MKVLIKTHEGIWQPCRINKKNLDKLKAKHKDNLRMLESD